MAIDVVYAVTTKRVEVRPGIWSVVQKGSHWPAGDPVVANNPGLFSTDPRWGMNYSVEPDGYDAPIEQATAAPGERRTTRRAGR